MAPSLLALLRSTNPICTPTWTVLGRSAGDLMFWMPPLATIVLEGLEHLPAGPCIVAPNHTHKFDFFPLRCALLHARIHGQREQQLMTWIKARDYRYPAMRWILGKGGNIPLASRGWLIASDFASVHGRAPGEEEYRLLRRHIDEGTPLPDELASGLSRPRSIGGVEVDIGRGYREALRDAYHALLAESLRLARQGRDVGRHQNIYPQGATSHQLTPGHNGAVQAALALGVPIVPVGMSGCREVFVSKSTPFTRAGTVRIRIGAPLNVPATLVPASFRPFHPDDEDEHKTALQSETDRLMEAINGLCEPSYQWAADRVSDGRQGVSRFYE